MKVLQITFRLSSGGGERFVVDLSNEISRKERVVLLQIISNENINNAHYLPDLSSRVKYINLGFKQGASLGVMMKILHVLKKEKPDVVHVHCALMPVALAVFLYRKPCYFHTLLVVSDKK